MFKLFDFSSDGDGRHDVSGVGTCGDVVLLLLSLVVSDDEACGAGARKIRYDGGANRHHEVSDECLHVVAHRLVVPPVNFAAIPGCYWVAKDSFRGLESGLMTFFSLVVMRLEAIRFVDGESQRQGGEHFVPRWREAFP